MKSVKFNFDLWLDSEEFGRDDGQMEKERQKDRKKKGKKERLRAVFHWPGRVDPSLFTRVFSASFPFLFSRHVSKNLFVYETFIYLF